MSYISKEETTLMLFNLLNIKVQNNMRNIIAVRGVVLEITLYKDGFTTTNDCGSSL